MAKSSNTRAKIPALMQRHPLQRYSSPSRGLSGAVHLAGLASFAYSFYFLCTNPNPINDAYGWHLQYLTIIGLAFSAITFLVAFLADLTLSSRLFHVKNALSVATAPLELVISALYWSLLSIDPKLVLPGHIPRIDVHTDISFHAAPTMLLVFDVLFLSPPWTITVVPSFILSSVIAVAYWFWVEACYAQNGFYPYPIFNTTVGMRMAIFAGAAVTMTISSAGLVRLYDLVNGTNVSRANNSTSGKSKRI